MKKSKSDSLKDNRVKKKFYTKLRSKYYLSVQPECTGGKKKNPTWKWHWLHILNYQRQKTGKLKLINISFIIFKSTCLDLIKKNRHFFKVLDKKIIKDKAIMMSLEWLIKKEANELEFWPMILKHLIPSAAHSLNLLSGDLSQTQMSDEILWKNSKTRYDIFCICPKDVVFWRKISILQTFLEA